MPASMIKAPVGSRPYVIGSSRATVIAGPIPGRTPTAVPTITPMRARSRLSGVAAVAKPSSRNWRFSISQRSAVRSGTSEDALQDSGRQAHDEADGEAVEGAQGQGRADHEVPDEVSAAQRDRRAVEEECAADDPAEQVDQEDVGDEHTE